MAAVRSAIASRQPGVDLIHHTDRGRQYGGCEYRRVLERAGMRQSMSRADECYHNAFMESCFGTLKRELEMECYGNEPIAGKEIGEYTRYYNSRRRHSALDYMTPEEFEDTRQVSAEPKGAGRRRPKSTSNLAQKTEKTSGTPTGDEL